MTGGALDRRRWLGAASLLALCAGPLGGLAGVAWARAASAKGRSIRAVAARLTELLRSPAAARQIGRTYLWLCTPTPSRDGLVAAVLPPVDQDTALDAERWELRQYVRDVVEDDFEQVRLVCIGGWMLAETEAQLCALAVEPVRA